MNLHDTPGAMPRSQIITPISYHPPSPSDPLLGSGQANNHDDSLPAWRQELAPDVLRSEGLERRFPDASFTRSANLPRVPVASPTAGTMLSHMMELSPSRAPLATEDELRVMLQHFSKRGMALRDRFFYTSVGFIELITQALEKWLMDASQEGELFVGIQRLSRAASRSPHYWALGQHASMV